MRVPGYSFSLLILPCRSFQQARPATARAGVVHCRGLADPNAGDQSRAGAEDARRPPPSVLCVGETLFDSLPEALFLGGATTNVGVHLASLGTLAAIVTCVGADRLGRDAIQRLEAKGVDARYVQRHPSLETGVVTASLDANGDASYAFDTPAAWDAIEMTEALRDLVRTFDGVTVIGTLASRLGSTQTSATSASAILELRDLARDDSVVLDINLRPPWYDPASVLTLCRGSRGGDGDAAPPSGRLALVKLNEEELPIVEGWCDLRASDALAGDGLRRRMEALGASLRARRVCVTRGGDGAALLLCGNDAGAGGGGAFAERGGRACAAEPGCDTVGAGDAFLAALLRSLLLEREPAGRALDRACALGAYVARRRGAVPEHDDAPDELREIFSFA